MLTNGSIIGKLRWESVQKDTNSVKHYERFFACLSNIYQLRAMHDTSTSPNSRNTLSNHDEQKMTSPYR
jgi:hypothetical protein